MTAERTGALDILFVGPLPPMAGGSTNVCVPLLLGLVRLGHRVRAVAAITPDTIRAGEAFASRHPELHLSWYRMPYFDPFPNAAPQSYRDDEGRQIRARLHELIDRDRPDIMVIGREILAWHAPDVALERGVPAIMLVHGGPSTQIVNGTYPKSLIEPLLEQFAKVNVIVAVAEHSARSLQALGLSNVRHVANPVDLVRFRPRPKDHALRQALKIDHHQVVVLHASNLQPEKRVPDLIRSAEQVLRRDHRLVYLVAGGGSGRVEVESECRERGIADRFRFVGWIDHERMPSYVSLADLVVMPSESETQALGYLEAQASARPLLASDIPAAREVVRDGETGLLFAMGDIEDLVAKTLLAARDPEWRARIGRAARAYIEQHHALDDVVDRYEEVLAGLVERQRPRANRGPPGRSCRKAR